MRDQSFAGDTNFKATSPAVIAPDLGNRSFNNSFKNANDTSAQSKDAGVQKMLVGFGIMGDETSESTNGEPKSPEALREQLLGAKTVADTKAFETDMVSALRQAHSEGGPDAAERFMHRFRTNDPFLLKGTGANLDKFGGDICTFSTRGQPQSTHFFYNPEHQQTADRAAQLIESIMKDTGDPFAAWGELRKIFQGSIDKLPHQGERVNLYDDLMKGVSSKLQLDVGRRSHEGENICVNNKNGERLLTLPMSLDFEKFPLSEKDLEAARKTADHIEKFGEIDEAAFKLVAGRVNEGYSNSQFFGGVNAELARRGTLYSLDLQTHNYMLGKDNPGYNPNAVTMVDDSNLVLHDAARPRQDKEWLVKREKTIRPAPRYEKSTFAFDGSESKD